MIIFNFDVLFENLQCYQIVKNARFDQDMISKFVKKIILKKWFTIISIKRDTKVKLYLIIIF